MITDRRTWVIHGGAALIALADRSFVHAMHVTTVFSALIAATGAVLMED